MSGYRDWAPSSEEHRPLTYWGGYPIYAVHFVVAVLVAAMIVTTVALNQQIGLWLQQLPFNSSRVLQGEVWRVLTYGFVQAPDIWLVVDYLMLVWFGREVERHVGRRTFFWLYGCIYLAPPLLLTLVGLGVPMRLSGGTGAFAVFVAFATLFPSAPLMFNILAKWAALILLGTYTLMHLAYHSYSPLLAMWISCGAAWAFTRYQQGTFELPRINLFKRKPRLRVLPDLKPSRAEASAKPARGAAAPASAAEPMAEIDALLDKIATSGISSLTPKERAKLEAAREGLLKRSASRE